jgi:hypothetical protein
LPKLFQNLRASRASELTNQHPAHVAATWLGNSTLIAKKQYWQVTDADFERANLSAAPCELINLPLPKAAQQALAGVEKVQKEDSSVD